MGEIKICPCLSLTLNLNLIITSSSISQLKKPETISLRIRIISRISLQDPGFMIVVGANDAGAGAGD